MDDDTHDHDPTLLDRVPVPSDRAVRILKATLFAVIALVAVWLVVSVIVLAARSNDYGGRIDELRSTNTAQDEALREANRRLEQAGEQPVTVPDTPAPGEQGEQGQAGSTGPMGPRGFPGATGPAGPAGPVGVAGKRGPHGFTGLDGPVGQQGSAGEQGPRGAEGATGPKGEPGEQGPQGPQGPQGDPGPPGTATPGSYQCEPGVMTGFTVAANGDVTVTCRPPLPLP